MGINIRKEENYLVIKAGQLKSTEIFPDLCEEIKYIGVQSERFMVTNQYLKCLKSTPRRILDTN
jgi:hypothetical protein